MLACISILLLGLASGSFFVLSLFDCCCWMADIFNLAGLNYCIWPHSLSFFSTDLSHEFESRQHHLFFSSSIVRLLPFKS